MQKQIDMTQGSPVKLILHFAWPILVGNIFNQFYNVVDAAIVGRFIGTDALAAVGSTGSLTFFLFTLVSGLCVGAGIVIAQYWGAQRYGELVSVIGNFLCLVFIAAAFLSILGFIIAPYALTLMQVPPAILPDAVAFFRICTGLFMGNAIYLAASAILRSMGNSRISLIAVIVASVMNIGLDLLFIGVFHWGVSGAAYATVISQWASAAICLYALWQIQSPFDFRCVRLAFDKQNVVLLAKIGLPTALQSSMIALGGMSVQGLVNSLGPATMAAYTSVQRIDSLAIQVVIAFSTALAVFTGQNMGTRDITRIQHALRQTLYVMTACCLTLAVLVFAFRTPLISLFINSENGAESIALGSQYLTIIGFAYVIAGIMNSFLAVIRGAGDVNASIAAGFFELGARIIFAYTLTHFIGVWGIWIATPLSWGCGCAVSIWRYYSGVWKQKAL